MEPDENGLEEIGWDSISEQGVLTVEEGETYVFLVGEGFIPKRGGLA